MNAKPQAAYNRQFFARRVKKYKSKELAVAKIFYDYFMPTSVCDAGCGIGSFLSCFQTQGCETFGLELGAEFAKPFADDAVKNNIHAADLSIDCTHLINKKYDLVLCIEVAEHIDQQYTQTFLANLCAMTDETILFSAATPGQRGKHHIHCKPVGYWVNQFACFGYPAWPVAIHDIRNALRAAGDVLSLAEKLIVLHKK